MTNKLILLLFLCSLLYIGAQAQNKIALDGLWQVELDTDNEWVKKDPANTKTSGKINLPGSLAENTFGFKTTGSDFGILTPEYKYVGKASYSRNITIPDNWVDKETTLFLERVLWGSQVLIDGKKISSQDALGTPHIHKLGKLSPGEYELTVIVDNDTIHNIGDKGHAYGEYTQSIWNGIVGKIELRAKDLTHFWSTKIYSDIQNNELTFKIELGSEMNANTHFSYEIESVKTGATLLAGEFFKKLSSGRNYFEYTIDTEEKLKLWSEFTPEVYLLKLKLSQKKYKDIFESEFGFCEFSHDGTKLLVNNTPVFLRGNLDCVHFPLTGYVSCDLEDWMRIFKTYKDYGLNHVRYHSWCPPEAAFKAANRMGIYMQAEASIWIDWWMSTNMVERGRPEMDTKGYPKGLGHDQERDKFVIAEMNRVVDTYGNHPSFTMFCIGNELGNSDFEVMKTWVADLKTKDPRRLYAVSTARTITEVDQYNATHYIKGIGRTRGLNGAKTNWDFEEFYGQMNIPIIAHEIGQWPVYPRWSEIEKYSGVLKARNFEKFKAQAMKNGIADQADDFANASGALNQLMYKYEIESFLRTPSCAGIQLLSMQDYQGQGEALIGWLDAHWESKGITTPKKFKQHHSETVPLARFDKYIWENNETFRAKLQVSHHSNKDLNDKVSWKILDQADKIIDSGDLDKVNLKNGTLSDVGEISVNLEKIKKAQQLKLLVQLENSNRNNEWDIWVYPKELSKDNGHDILVVNEINEQVFEKLNAGAKVLLQAHQLGTEETSVKALFYPLYWSLTFFPGQGKTNIGLLLQNEHKAFENFPTQFHSNWQWESISSDAKGFILNELPSHYKPLGQPVDDFHRNNKIGSIMEFKVGKGKLLVCGYNLNADKPVARQLKYSLTEYAKSNAFNPTHDVSEEWIIKTFKAIQRAETATVSGEFENAILNIKAGVNSKEKNKSVKWNPQLDQVEKTPEISYQLKADGTWLEEEHSAWHGKEMELSIVCPDGMLGTLLVHFHDWNKNDRTGVLEFEGRKTKLEAHTEGVWIKFHVMREDSNDGKLRLKTKGETGPNLMITQVILLKE